ncbi:MAG: hypothetical protein KZQ58_09700 [gamma proteobacterium symbiont of Bathyaustriella thionipta]|nr:hypothetical protein [gamma proteobacterium symbiont of Bathyaustriella thionipta]
MQNQQTPPAPQLHSSIVALVSLAAGIASKHPDMGLCQLDKLQAMGIRQEQIATVIEIARHIRDEAAQKLDFAFDDKAGFETAEPEPAASASIPLNLISSEHKPDETQASCCSSTASGQSCC